MRGRARRLEHDGVAVNQCRGNLPDGDGHREIPGSDDAHHPERYTRRVDKRARIHRRDDIAARPHTLGRIKPKQGDTSSRLAARFRDGFAVFPHHRLGDFLEPALENIGSLAQEFAARKARQRFPVRQRRIGGVDGAAHIPDVRRRKPADHVARICRINGAEGIARRYPSAVNIVPACVGHLASLMRNARLDRPGSGGLPGGERSSDGSLWLRDPETTARPDYKSA